MSVFADAVRWILDPANWQGGDTPGIAFRLQEHLVYSGLGVGVACAVAVPIGLFIGHTRRGEFVAVSVANLGRAIPSFAILSIVFQIMLNYWPEIAFGLGPTVFAMILLAIPPILTNTYVGVQQVDRDAVEAARGMGMTGTQALRRLELPLAAPLIVTGIRTAAVQVIATATLAALIGGGGLGRFIVDGFSQGDDVLIVAGGILVALLAIAAELVFGALARLARPRLTSAVAPV